MRLKQQTVFYGTPPKHAVDCTGAVYTKNFVFILEMFYRRFAISTPYLNGVTSTHVVYIVY